MVRNVEFDIINSLSNIVAVSKQIFLLWMKVTSKMDNGLAQSPQH